MKTIQILAVLILMLASQVLSANTEPTRGTSMYAEGTILKVWAVNGLNMRDGPGRDFPVSRKLHYGDEVKVTDPFIGDFPMSIKVIDKKGKDQDFELKGNWVRVMLADVEGYVFDGYLSRLPVIRLNAITRDRKGHMVCETEYIETYLNRKFDLEKESQEELSENERELFFEEGVSYYEGGNEGCGWSGLKLKDLSINEGYLIYNLMFNIESNVNKDDFDFKIEKDEDGTMRIMLIDDFSVFTLEFDADGVVVRSEGCC